MAIQKITGDVIATSAVTADSLADTTITAAKLHTTLDLTGKTVTVSTASAGDNDTTVASTAFVATAVANLADSAPDTLNTLNELAAALGDDANFSTTVTNSIAAKLPLAGGSLTGALAITAAGNQLTLSRSGFDNILFGTGTVNGQVGFHITNSTDSVVPFSMHENAPAASLVLDSSGNVGIGIHNPGTYVNDDNSLAVLGQVRIQGVTNTAAVPILALRDTNSGLFAPASNEIGISTAAVERMRIDGSGNVGIGTNDPKTTLNVAANDSGQGPILTLENTDTSITTGDVIGQIDFYANDGSSNGTGPKVNIKAVAASSAGTVTELTFGTSPSTSATAIERMRIDASGNVGIGQTAPGVTLDIKTSTANTNGVVRIQNNMDNNYEALRIHSLGDFDAQISFIAEGSSTYWGGFGIDYSDAGKFKLQTDNLFAGGSTLMTWARDGKVGIGATNPSTILNVRDSGADIVSGDAIEGSTMKGIFLENSVNDSSSLGLWYSCPSGNHQAGIAFRRNNHTSSWGTDIRFFTHEDATVNVDVSRERMIVNSEGNLGIGTSSPESRLHISNNAAPANDVTLLTLQNGNGTGDIGTPDTFIDFTFKDSNANTTPQARIGAHAGDGGDANTTILEGKGYLTFHTSDTTGTTAAAPPERLRIDPAGKVGIGTDTPATGLHVVTAGGTTPFRVQGGGNSGVNIMEVGYAGGSAGANFVVNDDGHVRINGAADDAFLNSYAGGTNVKAAMFQSLGSNKLSIAPYISNGAFSSLSHTNDIAIIAESAGGIVIAHHASGNKGIRIVDNGDLEVGGALSKASGSFKIDHPLESKTDTHHLVHSFVEAPQADNIYRGVVVLENGSATINLDTEAGMTEGTYVLLNTNTSCFTSNETDWDAVKGSVSGNILTISCQNSLSTATVSWLVIGERHDQHMKDTDWTDENGRVIVEPLKRVIEDE